MEMLRGKHVALIWMRLGPYHIARASAAQKTLAAAGCKLSVIEVSSSDHYEWDTKDTPRPAWVITLFPGLDYKTISRHRIKKAVRSCLETLNIDVVIANGWSVPEARAALLWAARKRTRRAVVMSETKADEARRWFLKESIKRWLLRSVQSGLVGGEAQARYLETLGVARKSIFLGYNAVDNDYFSEHASSARKIGARPHGIDGPYFFACTRFLRRKNLDGLLRGYALYLNCVGSNERWKLVISGSGDEAAALRRLSNELKLEDRVVWTGFLQYAELPQWYGFAGAFIHPAKSEPWGLVVNEAAASSLPLLVAAPVGAGLELVSDGVNGFVFDPHSDDSIAFAMQRMAQLSDRERQEMGQASLRRVEAFGTYRFAHGLMHAIRAALQKSQ